MRCPLRLGEEDVVVAHHLGDARAQRAHRQPGKGGAQGDAGQDHVAHEVDRVDHFQGLVGDHVLTAPLFQDNLLTFVVP